MGSSGSMLGEESSFEAISLPSGPRTERVISKLEPIFPVSQEIVQSSAFLPLKV